MGISYVLSYPFCPWERTTIHSTPLRQLGSWHPHLAELYLTHPDSPKKLCWTPWEGGEERQILFRCYFIWLLANNISKQDFPFIKYMPISLVRSTCSRWKPALASRGLCGYHHEGGEGDGRGAMASAIRAALVLENMGYWCEASPEYSITLNDLSFEEKIVFSNFNIDWIIELLFGI